MFSSIIKKTIAFSAAVTLSSSFLFSGDFKDSLEKLTYLKSLSSLPTSPWSEPSTILSYYTRSEIDSQPTLIEKLQKASSDPELKVQKIYFESGASKAHLQDKLQISDDELELRLKNKTNFVYINKSQINKPPVFIQPEDFDKWISKCQYSVIDTNTISGFYNQCRKSILNDDDYGLVLLDLNEDEEKIVEIYSKHYYKTPVLKINKEVAEHLGLGEGGVYLMKMNSIYHGDFGSDTNGKLKFIKFSGEFNLDALMAFVNSKSVPEIYLCDSFDKLGKCLKAIYLGSHKALYVLTSNISSDSKKYREWIEILHKIKTKYQDQLTIVILPNDEIARKLALVRSKRLRNFSIPEARFVDFSKIISTTKDSNGKFPIIDCSLDKSKCSELIDSYYPLKNNFDKPWSYTNVETFIDQSLAGDFSTFYETDTTPSTHVRKLCAVNFNEHVLKSNKHVIVELYGKYCPGCIGFKKFYNEIAEEMSERTDLVFAKICVDHNMVPELTDKKPHTPIFWIYLNGMKDRPIVYEGKLKKDELVKFIEKNLTQESN